MTKLGKAGLRQFLSDCLYVDTHNELATSIFYTLQQALMDVMASNLATSLYDAHNFNPIGSLDRH